MPPLPLGMCAEIFSIWPTIVLERLLTNEDLAFNQSHLIITFVPPMSHEFRCRRMKEHLDRMTSLEGWFSTVPIIL